MNRILSMAKSLGLLKSENQRLQEEKKAWQDIYQKEIAEQAKKIATIQAEFADRNNVYFEAMKKNRQQAERITMLTTTCDNFQKNMDTLQAENKRLKEHNKSLQHSHDLLILLDHYCRTNDIDISEALAVKPQGGE